jgi:hypothetical protein
MHKYTQYTGKNRGWFWVSWGSQKAAPGSTALAAAREPSIVVQAPAYMPLSHLMIS